MCLWATISDGARKGAVVLCALLVAGCASWRGPRIDPSGDRFLVEGPGGSPPGLRRWPLPTTMPTSNTVGLILSPQVTVVPVASEVVLLAAVRGPDKYLRTNQRIDWTLDPSGAGQFVDLDRGSWANYLVGDFTRPAILDANHAVNSTSRSTLRLTRGTPSPDDDILVLRGQTWISLTSAAEGTSQITVIAPSVPPGEAAQQSAVVHWIDAQWSFPALAIAPAGSRHVFRTTVTRLTNQAPRENMLVRYEIVDGPPAGFAPEGATSVDMPTDPTGQASVEIFQKQPSPGTNRVAIQIIRPPMACGGGESLVLGSGAVLMTWSAPGILVRGSGPATAALDAAIPYRFEVVNSGDQPAGDVTVRVTLPPGLTCVASDPPAQAAAAGPAWSLGSLSAAEARAVELQLRAEQPGNYSVCAEATANGGLTARDCVATAVPPPAAPPVAPAPTAPTPAPPVQASVDVQVRGPDRATVGDKVEFEIVIANRSDVTARNLVVRDQFDRGLIQMDEQGRLHEALQGRIERDLGDLGPRQSRRIGIDFRVAGPGRLCHAVDVTADGGVQASDRACMTVLTQPLAQPPRQPPAQPPIETPPQLPVPSPPKPPAEPGKLEINVAAPSAATVGEVLVATIEVTNTGRSALSNVKVTCSADPPLLVKRASEGVKKASEGVFFWLVPSMAPGGRQRFQLTAAGQEAAAKACIRASATADEGVKAENAACLEIRPAKSAPKSSLSMIVESLRNPVAKGKEFTYRIEVKNNGTAPDRQVTLTVTLPQELLPVRLGTYGPTAATFDGQILHFAPLTSLGPGQTAEYRVRVRAQEAGEAVLHADLHAENLRLPLVEEGKVFIFSEGSGVGSRESGEGKR